MLGFFEFLGINIAKAFSKELGLGLLVWSADNWIWIRPDKMPDLI